MGTGKRVFISYSHDSEAHREWVLALSERLREDGIETILDRYVNGTPAEGWPRWMLNGLDQADRVLLVCTPTYYRRFRGHEVPGKGKGVDWEGAVITQEIYDARSVTTRFIPVLFDPAHEAEIPDPVRGHTHYCLTSEPAYQDLCDALLDQAGVEPRPVGAIRPRERRRAEPLTFGDAAAAPTEPHPPKIDLTHLPSGADHFLGRGPELAALDAAWAPGASGAGQTAICECIAPGGTGKTALVKRWLDGVRAAGWGGAQRVYAWSFYSQGTGDDRQASEDLFLATALDWFGVDIAPAAHPADKGRALAEAVAARRTLLILDGCEPLQYPPGPLAGGLRAPGLKALLTHLASAGQPGLCVLTSREWLQDLAEWVRGPGHPGGPVLRLDLGNLDPADGACLLHTLGANQAGAAGIKPDDPELMAASREVRGHALTLSLLGRYLALAEDGDVRRRDRVDLAAASEATGGHAFRVMAAYETWFARAGQAGARELAVLRLLGFFDRPASAEDLAALAGRAAHPGAHRGPVRQARRRAGLRRPEPIPERDWAIALKRLGQAGLVAQARVDGGAEPWGIGGGRHGPGRDARAPLDAHPLVREYLAAALKAANPEAFREGHRRLYERLKRSAPPTAPRAWPGCNPSTRPWPTAAWRGSGRRSASEVYLDRILRGTGGDGFYSIKKLGAFGADLGAVACLFAEPWTRPAPALSEGDQAWLLNEAAFRLRALGRLGEALGPMRAGAEMAVRQEDWKNAAVIYGNLSELQLTLGLVLEAVADAQALRGPRRPQRRCLPAHGQCAPPWRTPCTNRARPGRPSRASPRPRRCRRSVSLQYPLLYSLQGFRYCDLLLAGAEGAAWAAAGGGTGRAPGDPGTAAGACEAVAGRARQTLEWAEADNLRPLLDYRPRPPHPGPLCPLRRPPGRSPPGPGGPGPGPAGPRRPARRRQPGHTPPRPAHPRLAAPGPGRHRLGPRPTSRRPSTSPAAAAWPCISPTSPCTAPGSSATPQALAEARRLIEAHDYGRRLPELAAAEAAAKGW